MMRLLLVKYALSLDGASGATAVLLVVQTRFEKETENVCALKAIISWKQQKRTAQAKKEARQNLAKTYQSALMKDACGVNGVLGALVHQTATELEPELENAAVKTLKNQLNLTDAAILKILKKGLIVTLATSAKMTINAKNVTSQNHKAERRTAGKIVMTMRSASRNANAQRKNVILKEIQTKKLQ